MMRRAARSAGQLSKHRGIPRRGNCAWKWFAMSESETFGPRLRRERERRGISLDTIVARTNVSLELWLGFEANDFSRWPTGLYARAFVREYAKAVGLDPVEVVDDFCRLFPVGDRRVLPTIRAQAELIGHETTATDDPRLIPEGIDRRANPDDPPDRPAPTRRRLFPRILGAIFHTHS
jgi:transcriptional regulator with XRE-family HTH domain